MRDMQCCGMERSGQIYVCLVKTNGRNKEGVRDISIKSNS